jgi:hypothetical protein
MESLVGENEWQARRDAAFIRLYGAAVGLAPDDGKGRCFDDSDTFGWYLFLAGAFLDHVWNYEPMFGSRVVPVFAAIGRNLELLGSVNGLTKRAKRLVGHERRQPNGGIFELCLWRQRIGGLEEMWPSATRNPVSRRRTTWT